MEYEFHDVANIFPMMNREEFAELVSSIKQNGQRDPIIIYEEKIIDGRNRYNACKELNIDPITEEWNGQGSLLDFVKDKNLNRRQLTPSQRGMVAARMKPLYEDEARKRQVALAGTRPSTDLTIHGWEGEKTNSKGETNEVVGKKLGVSKATVERASRVIERGVPEVIAAVEAGDLTVREADRIVRKPTEVQGELLQQHRDNPRRKTAKTEIKKDLPESTADQEESPISIPYFERAVNTFLCEINPMTLAPIMVSQMNSNDKKILLNHVDEIRMWMDRLEDVIKKGKGWC